MAASSTSPRDCPAARPRVRSYLPHPDLRGRRVLVVDDNAVALKIMSEMLRSMTFRVEVAGSGEQSIAAAGDADRRGDPFAIVFLDWRMPGLDGIETARRMAAMPWPHRPAASSSRHTAARKSSTKRKVLALTAS